MEDKVIPSNIKARIDQLNDADARKAVEENFIAYRENDHALLDHCLFFHGMKSMGDTINNERKILLDALEKATGALERATKGAFTITGGAGISGARFTEIHHIGVHCRNVLNKIKS